MLIFKEIESDIRHLRDRIEKLGSYENSSAADNQLRLLMQVVKYINSMRWLSHSKLRDKVRAFLQNHYSYEQVAVEFDISIKKAHKSISYAANSLRQQLGATLLLIREGKIDEAERELAMVTGTIDTTSVFVTGVTERFKPMKSPGVVFADCQKEIQFLRAFSLRNFDKIVTSLDEEKVSQLLYVLCSRDSTYVHERAILWDCLIDGKLSVNEAITALNNEFIYR